MTEKRTIVLIIEKSRAYGRALCEGAAAFAQQQEDWELRMADALTPREVASLRDVDGVIVRIMSEEMRRAVTKLGVPAVDVFGWRRYPGIALVDCDHDAIGHLAADCFLERRFQHFAFFGYRGVPFSDIREMSFSAALQAKGFSCGVFQEAPLQAKFFSENVILHEKLQLEFDRGRVGDWLKRLPKPVGVFCCHDMRAYQLAALAKQLGLDVPREVAILGVDDDRLVCGFSSPMLSSIDPDAFTVGYRAAEQIADQLERSRAAEMPVVRVVPRKLIERASTEVYPVEPDWLADAMIFIQRHYMENISAEDIFTQSKHSHAIVESTFRKVVGRTVRQEIIRVRLESAARLLAETTLPIQEVSKRTGFMTPQYFNLSFHGRFGVSPGNYRERHGKR